MSILRTSRIGGEAETRLAGAVNIAKLPELLRKPQSDQWN
jgi:hypothetical protein